MPLFYWFNNEFDFLLFLVPANRSVFSQLLWASHRALAPCYLCKTWRVTRQPVLNCRDHEPGSATLKPSSCFHVMFIRPFAHFAWAQHLRSHPVKTNSVSQLRKLHSCFPQRITKVNIFSPSRFPFRSLFVVEELKVAGWSHPIAEIPENLIMQIGQPKG